MSGVEGYLSDDKHWRMPVGWVMMIVGGWSLEGWGLSVDTLLANWPKADLLDEAEVGGYCILVLAIGCSEVIQGVHTVVFWSLCRQWSWSNIWPTVFIIVTRFFAFFSWYTNLQEGQSFLQEVILFESSTPLRVVDQRALWQYVYLTLGATFLHTLVAN